MSTLTITRRRRYRRTQVRKSASQRTQRLSFALGFGISALLVLGTFFVALVYASLTRSLPSIDELPVLLNPADGQLLQPTRLYDRTGLHLLAVLAPKDAKRVYARFTDMPQSLIDATVALAQPDFWRSSGYVFSGWNDPDVHPTLAQNLVSELLLSDEPASPLRAIHERMLAAQVTARFGRQTILEWYLNSADYGHYAFGAEAASQYYFGKSVTQIDLGEAALLAALSQVPSVDPYTEPGITEQNRLLVIKVMLEQRLITSGQAAQAVLYPPTLQPHSAEGGAGANVSTGDGTLAPAFVRHVLSQLDLQFGPGRVERGGVTITTTLDYGLQLQFLCALQTQVDRLDGEGAPLSALDGSDCAAAGLLPALQQDDKLANASASALMLNPANGQILVAVGDFQDGVQNNALKNHQAGTIITPFIYLTGFSRGLNPASLGWDIPGDTPIPGRVYHGPVRLRTALVNDYLQPALNLIGKMGPESIQGIASSLGIQYPKRISLLQDDFDISPLTLATAYGVFADSGILAGRILADSSQVSSSVLKVNGIDHSIWTDWSAVQSRLLLSPQLSYIMNQVLSDETARWPSLGHPNPLEIGRPAGGKMGPALDGSGSWTVGYTPQRLVVVWLGSDTGSIAKGDAADSASQYQRYSADLWHALMQYGVTNLPSVSWDKPSGVVSMAVCDPSGLLPTAACPNVVNEIFLDGRQPVQTDTLYQSFEVNAETGLLATVFTPPELVETRTFLVVPPDARTWARLAGFPDPPTEYDNVQKPAVLIDANITSPDLFSDGRGNIVIHGTAAGPDFVSYRLEVGQGLYPTAWTLVGSDTESPVVDGILGEWDTTGLDGLYSLRLIILRTNQRIDQAVVQVTLDNTPPQLAISFPQEGQTINKSAEPDVTFQALASDPFLEKVDFFLDGIRVGSSSQAPFGVIWTTKIGQHTLRVVASDRAGNTSQATVDFTVEE